MNKQIKRINNHYCCLWQNKNIGYIHFFNGWARFNWNFSSGGQTFTHQRAMSRDFYTLGDDNDDDNEMIKTMTIFSIVMTCVALVTFGHVDCSKGLGFCRRHLDFLPPYPRSAVLFLTKCKWRVHDKKAFLACNQRHGEIAEDRRNIGNSFGNRTRVTDRQTQTDVWIQTRGWP